MRRLLALAACLLLAAPVSAQMSPPPPELVDQLTAHARTALPRARLRDGSHLPPETEAERARPIVARALEVQTIERGLLTARIEACALDWQRLSYLRYMAALRSSGRYSDKQMAYVGMLHGITQGIAQGQMAEGEQACDDDERTRLIAEAASRAIETP